MMGVECISVTDGEDDEMNVHMVVLLVDPGILCTCWTDLDHVITGLSTGSLGLNMCTRYSLLSFFGWLNVIIPMS